MPVIVFFCFLNECSLTLCVCLCVLSIYSPLALVMGLMGLLTVSVTASLMDSHDFI